LLINSATPIVQDSGAPLTIQQSGAGFLNVWNAVNSSIVASPVSLSFGSGSGTVDQTSNLTVTNVGAAADTFSFVAQPIGDGPGPMLSANSVPLNPGQSQTMAIRFTASSLNPGAYQGYIQIQGTQNSVMSRVPYWYGVPSGVATHVTILDSPTNGIPGTVQSIYVRPTDDQGLAVSDPPSVTVTSGSGTLSVVRSVDSVFPGAYEIRVRVAAGTNIFHVASGGTSTDVTIQSP
jgi:hypothetical protein